MQHILSMPLTTGNDDSRNDDDSEYNTYNDLLFVDEAWEKLRGELGASTTDSELSVIKQAMSLQYEGITLGDLLQNGVDGVQGGSFGLWLLHKHYDLNDPSERMVSRPYSDPDPLHTDATITEPKPRDNSTQVVERWAPNFVGLEFMEVAKGTSPVEPTPEFQRIFRDILDNNHVTVLGLCLPQQLGSDQVLIEMSGDEERTQITWRMHRDNPKPPSDGTTYQTSWTFDSSGPLQGLVRCIHQCICTTPPKGSTKPIQGQSNALNAHGVDYTPTPSTNQKHGIRISSEAVPGLASASKSRSSAQVM